MNIFYILRDQPLSGLALMVSLAVIGWSLFMVRRVDNRNDRILTGLIGGIAVMQGLRVLVGAGLFFEPQRTRTDDLVNLFVALVYLAVLWFLKKLSSQYLAMRYALRLAEGNQALPVFHTNPVRKPEPYSNGLLDAVPLAMFAVSLDGNVSCWNRAAERTLGWTRDEVVGHKLPRLVLDPDDADSLFGKMQLVRKDGAPLASEVRSVPIRDAKGSVSGILTIVQA